MGKALGDYTDLESQATSLIIVRLIFQHFVEQQPSVGRPWSWTTNDEAMARRAMGIMRRLGVDEALWDMSIADSEQNASCDEDWEGFLEQLGALVS
jgi:hypothetical protein